MKLLTKILVYSNPIGWIIGVGIVLGVALANISKGIDKVNKSLLEEENEKRKW